MEDAISKLKELSTTLNSVDKNKAFDMGYDCAKNGANETNCHFSLFSKPELTKAWEYGKDKYFDEINEKSKAK